MLIFSIYKLENRSNLATIKYNRVATEDFIKDQKGAFYFIVDVSEWEAPYSEINDTMKINQEADFKRGREILFLIVGDRKVFSEMLLEVFIGNNDGRQSIVVVKDFEDAIKGFEQLNIDTKDIQLLYDDYQKSLSLKETENTYMKLPI